MRSKPDGVKIPPSTRWKSVRQTAAVEFEPEFIQALERAITPSDADVMVARGVILTSVHESAEPVLLTTFEAGWLAAVGGQAPAERTTLQALPSADPGRRYADPAADDPHLLVLKARHAVRWAIAQLQAEGEIARGPGNQYPINPEHVPVRHASGGGSAPVLVHSPDIGDGGGSTPRFMAVHDRGNVEDALLPVDEMVAGLGDLLGVRGTELICESRRALRSRLYLASASLLAAASEAAWFNLARSVPTPPAKLSELVDAGRDIAQVIKLTEQHLRAIPRSQTMITEAVAQAHLFRDIRNYALHPVEDHDQDRQSWLTEAGATVLTIAARRYFVKLSDLQHKLRGIPAPEVKTIRPETPSEPD